MKSDIDFASGWRIFLVVILIVQSGNCFHRFSKNSEEDRNTHRRPSSSSSSSSSSKSVPAQSSLLPGSSPSLVNLIYTWLHPGDVTHHKPGNLAGFPFSHSGVMVGSHGPTKGHHNVDSSDESGIPWEQSTNNRPQGGLGGAQHFHPHFGQAYRWPWTSNIKSAGRDWYTVQRGMQFNKTFAIYYWSESGPISPFHDIPLFANEGNKIFNMVVEVSRWSNAKLEIATTEPLNPIKQDTKKGKLRYVANVFPHHGYMWNYGALPQTWENPQHIDESTGERGDNDPIDVCEIGYRVARPGEVLQVKVLGVIGLVDEGETDWKLVAIDVNDPLAPQLSDITDVEQHMPGYLKATVEWFKLYKVPDGKPENQFAFNGEAKDRDFAHQIILGTHVEWRDLVSGKSDGGKLHIGAVTVPYAAAPLTIDQANKIIEGSPVFVEGQPLDPKVDQWHFVNPK